MSERDPNPRPEDEAPGTFDDPVEVDAEDDDDLEDDPAYDPDDPELKRLKGA